MQNIKRIDWIFLIVLILIALVGEVLFFNRQGDFMVDVGREFYLSKEVALGKLLYKDIFNIYGPLSYQINACLFKLFGFHTNVLVIAGNICGLAIVGSFYSLSRQFLAPVFSFAITAFITFAGIYNDWIFSFTVAYSYAMIYGLLAVIVALIFLVKYVKNKENNKYLYLSLLFAGSLLVFKYDYLPFLLLYPYVFITEKVEYKVFPKAFACFFLVPLISVLPLFWGGLNYGDIVFNVELMKKVSSAPSLKYFYGFMEVMPNAETFIKTLINLFLISGILGLIYKIFSRVENIWVYLLVGFVCFIIQGLDFIFVKKLSFLSVLILALALILNRKITNKTHWLLILSALLLSMKMFLWTNLFTYGIYCFPFLLLCVVVLLKDYLCRHEKAFEHSIVIFLILLVLPLLFFRYEHSKNYDVKVETQYGTLRTHKELSPVKLLLEYMTKKLKESDSVVILPEGHIINFLTNTKSDDFYSNFIPMYVEAFGEDNIINHYKKNSPDYFILSTRDSTEYGYTYICKDYAQNLCDWIFNNYYVVAKIVGEPQYTILRKNK